MWPTIGSTSGRPLLVAHRGGAFLAHGDVLEGVRRLASLRADAVEFDVRRTADGTLIVHHDEAVNGRSINHWNYRALREYYENVPTLTNVLDEIDRHMALDVELKEPGYEADVVSEVCAAVEKHRVIVTSFSDDAVRAVKDLAPEIPVGLIVGRRPTMRRPWDSVRDMIPFERLRRCQADFLAPSIYLRVTGLFQRARTQHVPLLLWTVSRPAAVNRYLHEPGVLGVVTNAPEALRRGQQSSS